MTFDLHLLPLQLSSLLISLTVHEWAHAWTSSLLGDDFARRQGRVSLNPLRHLDPLGTLAILLLPFGWGKPVPVNLYNYKHPKRDYLLSSLAGPASNVLVVVAGLGLLRLTQHSFVFGMAAAPWMGRGHLLLQAVVFVSGVLAMVNLLPIPPLDGSKIWPCLLPGRKASFTGRSSTMWMIVVCILFSRGALDPVFKPVIHQLQAALPPSAIERLTDVIDDVRQAEGAKQYAKAEVLWSKALAICPQSAAVRMGRAYARGERGHWQAALDDLNEAARLSPGEPLVYQARATAQLWLGHPEEAQKDLETFKRLGGKLQLDPPTDESK